MTRLLICGLGRSGKAVARAALTHDAFAALTRLTIIDEHDTPALRAALDELELIAARQRPTLELCAYLGVSELSAEAGSFEMGVISPGLAPHNPLTISALKHCDELISELEFAYRLAPPAQRWIAITGSNGKTTTTMLCAHILREAGRSVASVGNIGDPVTDAVLRPEEAPDILVVEASSFQLDFTTSFAPQAAALLNVAPDHLDWHGSLENYASAKRKIFARQRAGDLALIWDADPFAARSRALIASRSATLQTVSLHPCSPPSAYLGGAQDGVTSGGRGGDQGGQCCDWLWLHPDAGSAPVALMPAGDLPVKGEHNILNALFAAALCAHAGLCAAEIAAGIASFKAPAHRLELVAEACGVRYYDDSKATNPDSVRAALTAFVPGEVHLLVGGRGKGTPYEDLARTAIARVRAVYAFGEEGPVLAASFSAAKARAGAPVPVTTYASMAEALRAAAAAATPGEAVLLSPACASFDEFQSYVERGEVFASCVRAIAQEPR